jgi:hypothetical protein
MGRHPYVRECSDGPSIHHVVQIHLQSLCLRRTQVANPAEHRVDDLQQEVDDISFSIARLEEKRERLRRLLYEAMAVRDQGFSSASREGSGQ